MKSLSDLSQGEVERILEIVDRLNDVELRLELGDMKLHVRKFSDASLAAASSLSMAQAQAVQPAQAAQPAQPAQAALQPPAAAPRSQPAPASAAATPAPSARTASQPGLVEVRAPMLGRFYRSSSPSEPPYVEVGSRVGADDTVCMIEVMKLFNTVPAGVSGTIVEIVAENGSMVEHDAILFRVRPE